MTLRETNFKGVIIHQTKKKKSKKDTENNIIANKERRSRTLSKTELQIHPYQRITHKGNRSDETGPKRVQLINTANLP